ncbi:MAG: ImpA family type VI secretion system protein [Endozoicomonas sp.]|uniref:type VI secretion system protein TssA n=1 Tax=Endozoicomonas sp. TaxID=1892382 RepID=UPI003D9B6673
MQGPLSEEHFDAYLTPLSEEAPAGEYLKGNKALYRSLRNAYNIAQTSFHKLSMNPDPQELDDLKLINSENWQALEELLLDCLKNHSRDLECMSWLAIAQMFSSTPYARLNTTLKLVDQSLKAFWPQIQPWLPDNKLQTENPENERAEHHHKILQRLLGESDTTCPLIPPLCMLPLVGDIDFSRYQRERSSLPELREMAVSALSSERTSVVEKIKDILQVSKTLDELDKTLETLLKPYSIPAPGSEYLRKQLDNNLSALKDLVGDTITPWPSIQSEAPHAHALPTISSTGDEPEVENPTSAKPAEQTTSIFQFNEKGFNRDQAFHQLRMLADFFQQTEPQSPVSYILEKAIRWGYTPLPQLMNELLQGNDQFLSRITELTGMNQIEKALIPGIPAPEHFKAPASVTTQPDIPPPEAPREAPREAPQEAPQESLQEPVISNENRVESDKTVDSTDSQNTSTSPVNIAGLDISNLNDLS